jgi:hypothetical protein
VSSTGVTLAVARRAMTDTRVVPRGAELLSELRLERDRLEALLAQLNALAAEDDRRSFERRRRLLRRLRPLVVAHCRAEDQAVCATLRAAQGHAPFDLLQREEHDLLARLAQLELIPTEHPFWAIHLTELTLRLKENIARGLKALYREACRVLAETELELLGVRFRTVRRETLELLKHQPAAWRQLLEVPATYTAPARIIRSQHS